MRIQPLRRFVTSLAFVLIIVGLSHHSAQAKDTWTTVHSKNFTLVGNASEKDIRGVANRMEQFRAVFALLFPAVPLNSPVPNTIIVFKSDGSFKPFKTNPNEAGYFQSGNDVNYIELTSERTGAEQQFRVIFHEYVHLL